MKHIPPKNYHSKAERELMRILVKMIVAERASGDTAMVTVVQFLPKIKEAFDKIYAEAKK